MKQSQTRLKTKLITNYIEYFNGKCSVKQFSNDGKIQIDNSTNQGLMKPQLGDYIPANMTRGINAGLLLGQRRRRWANSKSTLGHSLMFPGIKQDDQ